MEDTKTTVCECGHIAMSNGFTPGYGITPDGKKICYQCRAENDKQYLRDNGRLSGYLTGNPGNMKFSNWSSSFTLNVQCYTKSWHNFAGRNGRIDFWVTWEGNKYHGIHVGNSHTCATIRKVNG